MKRYDSYKPSGVAWIDEIPSHWEMVRCGGRFSFGKGLPITKADLKPQGIPVISYGQIHSKNNTGVAIRPELIRFVDKSYLDSNPQCLVRIGDFIFADTSEDIEGSGNSAYNDSLEPLFAGYHTIIARPHESRSNKYIAYLFQSKAWKQQIQQAVNAVKVYSIGRRLIKQSTILVPPVEEQAGIVAFLDSKTSKIDSYVAERERVS